MTVLGAMIQFVANHSIMMRYIYRIKVTVLGSKIHAHLTSHIKMHPSDFTIIITPIQHLFVTYH